MAAVNSGCRGQEKISCDRGFRDLWGGSQIATFAQATNNGEAIKLGGSI